MKKWLVSLIAIMLLALAVPVSAADVRYTKYKNVKVYEERETDSDVLKTLGAGEKVLIEKVNSNGQWAAILVEDDDEQTLGWIHTSNLSYTMPPNLCSHKWTAWEIYREPTCTEKGMRIRSCPVCGTEQSQEIDKLPHNFGGWTITKEATCTSEGSRVRTCSSCGKQETHTIEKLAHSYGDWKVTKEATCTAEGSRVRKCRVCGHENVQTLEKLPHSYGEWTVTKEPTCTSEGEITHKCKICGHVGKESTEKLPHDYETKIIVEATDHSSGIRTNVCRVCGYTQEQVSYDPEGTLRRGDRNEAVREVQQLLADQNFLSADGADGIFGGGTEKAIAAFQESQGLTADGVAWPQTIARLRHHFGEWEVITEPTRTEGGERVRRCKDCNYEQHEVIELSPFIERGDRSESVRAIQQMLSAAGHDAGSYDGIYGPKLDAAFDGFAKDNNLEFEAGKVLPAQIDALVNSWIATLPKENWMGEGSIETPVNLALTITPADDEGDEIKTFNWSLTNLGNDECIFTTLLLNFGDDSGFLKDNLVMVVDGEELKGNCGNSVSGSFTVSRDWGEGSMNFSALAISEEDGTAWLSNCDIIEEDIIQIKEIAPEAEETASVAEEAAA